MRISVEFDSMEEFEQFRVSGKATRQRKKDEVEEVTPVEQTAQAIRDAQPLATQPVQPVQTFAPAAAPQGFPGGNSGTAPAHPLVNAILARIDGAVASGQPAEAIVTWFRQQIGPEAKDATLEQIKQVFVPRMTKTQLEQIAPQLGIAQG